MGWYLRRCESECESCEGYQKEVCASELVTRRLVRTFRDGHAPPSLYSRFGTKGLDMAYWDPGTLDYTGFCGGSSLREPKTRREKLESSQEDMKAEVELMLKNRLENQRREGREHGQYPEVKEHR